MLQMYINSLLIDAIEVDFIFCDTLKKREARVEELCHFLANTHFSKSFVAHKKPHFRLVAGSRVNQAIKDDELINELVPELEKELQNNKKQMRICR